MRMPVCEWCGQERSVQLSRVKVGTHVHLFWVCEPCATEWPARSKVEPGTQEYNRYLAETVAKQLRGGYRHGNC